MTLRFWLEMLSAIGYGVLSSIVPVFHTEGFIIAGAATGVLGALPMSLGLAVGHSVGKQVMFQGVRQGKKLKWVQRQSEKAPPPEGSWRARWREWGIRTAHVVEDPKWGYPLLLVSAISGTPPVYFLSLIHI